MERRTLAELIEAQNAIDKELDGFLDELDAGTNSIKDKKKKERAVKAVQLMRGAPINSEVFKRCFKAYNHCF